MPRSVSLNVPCSEEEEKTCWSTPLLPFCLSHFTPSSSVPSSFSPRHSASGNAFKLPKPGKKATFTLVEHSLFWSTPKPSPVSFVCPSLWSFLLPLCSLLNSKIEKHHFLNLIVVLVVDLLLQWECFTWGQMEEKYFLHQYSVRQTERQCSISFTYPGALCGWDGPLKWDPPPTWYSRGKSSERTYCFNFKVLCLVSVGRKPRSFSQWKASFLGFSSLSYHHHTYTHADE